MMAARDVEVVIGVRFSLSLWQAIKMRIAGMDKLREWIVAEVSGSIGAPR